MSFPNVRARMAFFAKQKDKGIKPDLSPMGSTQHAKIQSLALPKPPAGPKPLPNEPKSPGLPKMAKFPKIKKFFKG